MRRIRAIFAVSVVSALAAGCGATGYGGYGPVDRSGLGSGPPNSRPGACYAQVVKPPVIRTSYRTVDASGEPVASKPKYKKVTRVVTERVPGRRSSGGGGGESTRWVRPGDVPPGARVIAQRASDGLLMVVLSGGSGGGSGGEGRVRRRTVTEYVPVGGGSSRGKRERYEKMVSPPRAVWAEVLCETPASRSVYAAAQKKLTRLGFYKGPVDGDVSSSFLRALRAYQESRRLASGGLTRETARSLGLRY